ncbi:MAG: hypothetical protein ACRDWT_02545 [Jatrophihabitantaceae bacterium]
MRDGWLGDRDVDNLARQAVDLLFPPAIVAVEALNPGGRWSTWGGLSMAPHRPRRVIVSIGPGNRCIIGVNPDWSPTYTLAHLIDMLGGACSHNFRGTPFPPCPGHDHHAIVDHDADSVILQCPDTHRTVRRLTPDLDTN